MGIVSRGSSVLASSENGHVAWSVPAYRYRAFETVIQKRKQTIGRALMLTPFSCGIVLRAEKERQRLLQVHNFRSCSGSPLYRTTGNRIRMELDNVDYILSALLQSIIRGVCLCSSLTCTCCSRSSSSACFRGTNFRQNNLHSLSSAFSPPLATSSLSPSTLLSSPALSYCLLFSFVDVVTRLTILCTLRHRV